MWQKIKFFFLRRMSDEKLRMWCVEQVTKDRRYTWGYEVSGSAEILFHYIRYGKPCTPEWYN